MDSRELYSDRRGLDERGRRRWAAAEARSLGRGGITAVAEAMGLSDRTIRNGIQELDAPLSGMAEKVDTDSWFSRNRGLDVSYVYEDVIPMPAYEQVLSLIWLE